MKADSLETARLFLERLTLKHLSQSYVEWLNDPEVNRFLESGGDYTIEKLKKYLIEQEKKDIFFGLFLPKKTSGILEMLKLTR